MVSFVGSSGIPDLEFIGIVWIFWVELFIEVQFRAILSFYCVEFIVSMYDDLGRKNSDLIVEFLQRQNAISVDESLKMVACR